MLHTTLLFLNIGSSEMILILGVALLLFGGEKLPELARGLGKGIRDFKEASEDVKREINNQINNFEDKKAEDNYRAAIAAPEPPVVENTIPVKDHYTGTEAPHVTEAQLPVHTDTHDQPVAETPAAEEHHQVAALTPETNYHAGVENKDEQHADKHL
jgi:sec-independent protein translocase protein TatA